MATLFVGLHIFICIFLVFVILLQPGKSDGGIGFGGSASQSIFGSKGASNFLTKTTSVCAIIFLFTSFVLTRARLKEHSESVIKAEPAQESKIPAPAAPSPGTSGATGQEPTKAAEPLKKTEPAKAAEPLKSEAPKK